LALTSNPGSQDFQMLKLSDGNEEYLFEQVLRESANWASVGQMMYVVGATQAEYIERVRAIVPNHFLLVPGVGAQGGSLEEISRLGLNQQCGLLVNSSRAIIYASSARDFADRAREAALEVQREMEQYLEQYVTHL
jgi:orotidine-5'-phosphate decarboxylase